MGRRVRKKSKRTYQGRRVHTFVDRKAEMLRVAIEASRKAGVKTAIGGGVAVAAQGYLRDTVDVDAFFHFQDRAAVLGAFRRTASDYQLEELDESHWIAVPPQASPEERIDLMFATGDPEESAIEMSEQKLYRGVRTPVFTVEWLVITKYLAGREDPKDLLDIYALHLRGAFDVGKVQRRLRQLGETEAAAKFPKLLKKLADLKNLD
jgi:hypothetical protein